MRRLIAAASLGLLLAASTGCVVYRQPGRAQRTVVVRERACHPSQYWDGTQCVHKGKGWGARKHDGR